MKVKEMWGDFVRALYPNWLPSTKLEINFVMVLLTGQHNTWFLRVFGSGNS